MHVASLPILTNDIFLLVFIAFHAANTIFSAFVVNFYCDRNTLAALYRLAFTCKSRNQKEISSIHKLQYERSKC